jgi:pSer/pThr/pTyr-binding forkhead associated (FHA) protein
MGFELRMAEGRGRGQRFRFDRQEVTIGRAPENDLVVHDIRASRSHVRIRALAKGYALLDDASCNGTHVNGRAARGTIALRDGDRIRVGNTIFEFSSASGRTVPANASAGVRLVREVVLSWPARARRLILAGGVSAVLVISAVVSETRGTARAAPPYGAAAGLDPVPASAAPFVRGAEELFAGATADVRTSRESYERGRRKLEERRIAPRNLFDAWRAFDGAVRSARGLLPSGAEAELQRLVDWAERELETQCRRLLFGAARFERYGEDGKAQAAYREALLHFPGDDPSGCRKKAQQNLLSADDVASPAVGVFGYAEER